MHFKYDLWLIIGKKDFEMGTAASKTQKIVLQIPTKRGQDKRGEDDRSKAKPFSSVELEVDLGIIASPYINVMFICSEWGSKKGGLSTFNRELAANLAKISNDRIKVHCYVSESIEAD